VLGWHFPHLSTASRSYEPTEVYAAAVAVERAVQLRLVDAGLGPKVSLRYARALWNAQWNAHEAVVICDGRKRAKTLQQQAAGEAKPLTVCVGYVFRRLPEGSMRYNAPDMVDADGNELRMSCGDGDGCGTIILDSREPRPPKRYCDRCAARAGRTMNAGLVKTHIAKLRAGRRRH
jgi:hypothetical protein